MGLLQPVTGWGTSDILHRPASFPRQPRNQGCQHSRQGPAALPRLPARAFSLLPALPRPYLNDLEDSGQLGIPKPSVKTFLAHFSFQQLRQMVKPLCFQGLSSSTWCLAVLSSVKHTINIPSDVFTDQLWSPPACAERMWGGPTKYPLRTAHPEVKRQIQSMRQTKSLYCDNKTKSNTQKALCKHSSLPLFQH